MNIKYKINIKIACFVSIFKLERLKNNLIYKVRCHFLEGGNFLASLNTSHFSETEKILADFFLEFVDIHIKDSLQELLFPSYNLSEQCRHLMLAHIKGPLLLVSRSAMT